MPNVNKKEPEKSFSATFLLKKKELEDVEGHQKGPAANKEMLDKECLHRSWQFIIGSQWTDDDLTRA